MAASSSASARGLLSECRTVRNLDADRNECSSRRSSGACDLGGEPPYDLHGKYWSISTRRTLIEDIGQGYIARPLQRPHPPIVVTAVAPFSKGVTEPRYAAGIRSRPTS